jgi:methylmalonyl-CoA mutase
MFAKKNNTTIFCNLDPIGQLAKEGNWFTTSEKSNFDTLNILSQTISTVSLFDIKCLVPECRSNYSAANCL